MARSQQSFNKRQKELTRQKRKEDKAERKKQRADTPGGGLDSMIAYVDENGQIVNEPPPKPKAGEDGSAEKG